MFVGTIADNFDQRIDQKILHCQILVDCNKVFAEEKQYHPIPYMYAVHFEDDEHMERTIDANYKQVKDGIHHLMAEEIQRIKKDPELAHYLDETDVSMYIKEEVKEQKPIKNVPTKDTVSDQLTNAQVQENKELADSQ